MGLLDNLIDPETLAQLKEFNQPSEQDRFNARNNALMNAGFAMMMNNGGMNQRQALFNALGAGGMAGMGAYQGTLDESRQMRQQELQQGVQFSQLAEQMRQKKAQQAMVEQMAQQHPQYADLLRMNPTEGLKRIYPEDNYKTVGDSLVRIGPSGAESVFQNKKLPDGMEIGPDGLPRFMPSYLAGKKEIAAAGKPSIENKVYNVAETEQAKQWGKTLGELRSGMANAAFTAPAKLAQLDRMEQLLSGVEGGKLAPLGMEVASAAKSLGLNIDPKLGNKEAAEALSREIAGSFRQPGTGPMTDKDFDNFLKRVPDLSKTANGRQEIFTTMRAALKRDIEANKIVSGYAKRRNGNIDDGVMDELSSFYAQNPVVNNKESGGGFKILGVR